MAPFWGRNVYPLRWYVGLRNAQTIVFFLCFLLATCLPPVISIVIFQLLFIVYPLPTKPTYFLFLFFFLLSHVPTILSSGISLSNPYLESVLCRKWTFGPGDFQQSSSPRRPILHVCRCLCFETTINGIGKTRSVCAKHFLIITQTSSLHSFHKLRN